MAGSIVGDVVATAWNIGGEMNPQGKKCANPMDPSCMSSLKHWGEPLYDKQGTSMAKNIFVDCGWGRLIFGQTFQDPEVLAETVSKEKKGRRDIAMYVRDPHVVISYAPQDLFIDPSLTYRLDFSDYKESHTAASCLRVRSLSSVEDIETVNRIYQSHNMVPYPRKCIEKILNRDEVTILLAEDFHTRNVVGAITGVDHFRAFNDPDNGSSLWALAVDPQCQVPKVGETLVRELVLRFIEEGRRFIDLSVMHSNKEAKALYAKLNFKQVPVYCIKKKNFINEHLYVGSCKEEDLNIYARIITDEARRRGIAIDVLDAENGYFQLALGGRSITCRESLSELTSAIAMSRCDDKSLTLKILREAGLNVPAQCSADNRDSVIDFLKMYKRVVVKPARGEQGEGVFVDLEHPDHVFEKIDKATAYTEKVLVEEFVEGIDLRIIVIDNRVVAAAVRKPATIKGNGEMNVQELIMKQSRRRAAATHGESNIPLDDETLRTLKNHGYSLEDVLPAGHEVSVRKTANLHTGGTIHDVTAQLHPDLIESAVNAAKALDIPVVGLDYIVRDVRENEYVIIEANERPGLANHEPQPTAECFIDLLFPQTKNTFEGD